MYIVNFNLPPVLLIKLLFAMYAKQSVLNCRKTKIDNFLVEPLSDFVLDIVTTFMASWSNL